MKIIEERKIIFIILFILFLLTPFFFAYFLLPQPPQPIKSRAQEDPNPPGSAAWCADHCNPSPATNPCNQSETYKFPDCCIELAKTGDPGACGWPDRGYCLDSQCASIPSDVNRQRCGGPKHSWCDLCTGNRCPGYGKPASTPTSVPTATPKLPTPTPPIAFPTSPPPPTQAPFIPSKPTTIPVFPTTIIPFLPTEEPPLPLPTSAPFELKLPKFMVPPEANRVVEKPLGFFRWVFLRIRYYDRLLEYKINKQIKTIFNF